MLRGVGEQRQILVLTNGSIQDDKETTLIWPLDQKGMSVDGRYEKNRKRNETRKTEVIPDM